MAQDEPVDVVIEASGGTVLNMYSDRKDVRVILVDWDEYREDGRPGVYFPVDLMSEMHPDTRALVRQAI